MEIDDRSVKFINADGDVISIPCGVINCILLGPGTSITHDAVKILAEYNCNVFWTGEDGLKFYACGMSPTADSKNFRLQMRLACDKKKSLEIARKMFARRFPDEDISDKSLAQLKGMEGIRVKNQYQFYADKYKVLWDYRNAHLTDFDDASETNKWITMFNQFIYSILCSATISLGYSPHIGFVHSGSPLPFIYDMADLYKEKLCIEPAFRLTDVAVFSKDNAIMEFVKNMNDMKILKQFEEDMKMLFGGQDDGADSE
jgi:CRISPR-associated protein Cas1